MDAMLDGCQLGAMVDRYNARWMPDATRMLGGRGRDARWMLCLNSIDNLPFLGRRSKSVNGNFQHLLMAARGVTISASSFGRGMHHCKHSQTITIRQCHLLNRHYCKAVSCTKIAIKMH